MAETAYPVVTSEDDLIPFAQEIARLRDQEDIPDSTNLKDKFVSKFDYNMAALEHKSDKITAVTEAILQERRQHLI